ncbi:A24 family peptidase [Nocardioides sp. BP30]|uniref:A24 family peptidase n=1 Tax=Nocardioides sp. BP30 TaxID=3036374 RepID=UPI0024697477|nr:A24 family peptidase [Nocardioides sp. BP30]WGL50436.1 A24 family peptidase [Nocardioides sp. BP30]
MLDASTGLAGLLALAVPSGIRRLPEPPPEVLPESPEDDTALERMLRAEGPKESYLRVAALPGLALWSAVVGVVADVAIGLRLGDHPVTWVIALLMPVLILLAVVDWRTRLLPRLVVLPVTAVLVVLALVEWLVGRETDVLVRTLVAGLVARSVFWVLWFIRRAGMGFGDVRLAALLGLVLGRLGWNHWLLGLYGGLVLFGVFGLTLTIVRRDRATLKRAYPFGPFMIGGTLLGVLLGGSVHLLA